MKIEVMNANIFKALGHPTRMEIIKLLNDQPLCVCEIFDKVESTQPNISQHLKLLKDADVLDSKRDGNKIIYLIKHDEVRKIISLSQMILHKEIMQLSKGE